MADLTAVGTVGKTLVTSLADDESYMVEENPALTGAYTMINGAASSSKNSSYQQSTTMANYPNLGNIGRGISIGGTNWTIDQDSGNMYYDIASQFRPNLTVDKICKDNGLAFAVEGLYKSVLLTSEESEIVKIWESSNDSIEEFFVLGAIHGNIDLDVMIALSEVSLGHLAGKKLADLYDMEGMSKNFFKIIEYTNYLDDLVLNKKFIKYWLERRQDLISSHSEAARLVTYMLLLIKTKRSELMCNQT